MKKNKNEMATVKTLPLTAPHSQFQHLHINMVSHEDHINESCMMPLCVMSINN